MKRRRKRRKMKKRGRARSPTSRWLYILILKITRRTSGRNSKSEILLLGRHHLSRDHPGKCLPRGLDPRLGKIVGGTSRWMA